MLIWLITPNLHFDVKAQLLDSLVLTLTSERHGGDAPLLQSRMFVDEV